MQLVLTSKSAIGRITLTGRVTGLAELTGAGFRDIGAVITRFGFTATTGPAD
jgi:hypothetical protein